MQRRLLLTGLVSLGARPAFALYDPKPDGALAAVQGEWRGALTYRDYSEPKRMVTLPTRLLIALSAPDELVLHYAFSDGPAKTVYSYERMRFDVAGREVTWASGQDAKAAVYRITADDTTGEVRSLLFERRDGSQVNRFTMRLSALALTLAKDEIDDAGVASFRNKFEFSRVRS
ncbi:MAG: hypothetical protein EOP35_10025 [Rubrivivax sp.]|nr:MAG: hypothetical protein EOP35_10025 [Rubrivivax sp.]